MLLPNRATYVLPLVIALSACTTTPTPPTLALLPLRMFYLQSEAVPLYDEDAATIEDAVRVSYGIVECRGDNAAAAAAELRRIADLDHDAISRVKNRIYVAKKGAPGLLTNCAVVGDDLVSIGSFSAIFSRSPHSQVEFEIQQWLWLSVRDDRTATPNAYTESFLSFLGENLGAEPISAAAVAAANHKLDAIYNPCGGGGGAFDVNARWTCVDGRPAPSGDLMPLAVALNGVLGKKNDELLGLVGKQTGLKATAKVKSSIAQLALSGGAPPAALSIQFGQSTDVVLEDAQMSTVRELIDARMQVIEKIFGLTSGMQLAPVVSVKNPRPLPLPPRLADGTLALPGQNDTSTMHAVPLSDGSYAVPNPTLRADLSIGRRWYRWTYGAGTGWSLAGTKGLPGFAAPTDVSTLASLVRPAAARSIEAKSYGDGLGGSVSALDGPQIVGAVGRNGYAAGTLGSAQQIISNTNVLKPNASTGYDPLTRNPFNLAGDVGTAVTEADPKLQAQTVDFLGFDNRGRIPSSGLQVTQITDASDNNMYVDSTDPSNPQYSPAFRDFQDPAAQAWLLDRWSKSTGTTATDLTPLAYPATQTWDGTVDPASSALQQQRAAQGKTSDASDASNPDGNNAAVASNGNAPGYSDDGEYGNNFPDGNGSTGNGLLADGSTTDGNAFDDPMVGGQLS